MIIIGIGSDIKAAIIAASAAGENMA